MTDYENKLENSIAQAIALLSTKPGMAGTVSDHAIVYKELCRRNAVTSDELDEAVMQYLESTRDADRFFPPAGVIVGIVKQSRQEKAEIERAMHLRSLVGCQDSEGNPWAALPEEIDERGVLKDSALQRNLLNIGERTQALECGNANALPASSVNDELREATAGRLEQLEARLTGRKKRRTPKLEPGETIEIDEEKRRRQIEMLRGEG